MATAFTPADDPLAKALSRVRDLEAELQASRNSLRDVKQDLEYFVYAASHDLQEPLRAVRSYAELLQRRYAQDAETTELTSLITDGVKRMNGLLHNLLAYSRLNPAPLFKTLRLNAAVQATLYKLAPSITAAAASVHVAVLPEVQGFEIQIGQLFEQLILNALTFRGADPLCVEITAEPGEMEGEAVEIIRVTDNGCGMEQQYFTQALMPFKRLHSKEYPGNGLGLSICDKIMRVHQGKIWIESKGPQQGISVCLAFPV